MNMKITLEGGKKVNAEFNGFIHKTDQPISAGGEGTAPSPFELFLASIGTCAGFYIASFCHSRGISPEGISISQKMSKNPATALTEKIDLEITLPADFPEKYRDALVNAANLCTVKKHLAHPPVIEVRTI